MKYNELVYFIDSLKKYISGEPINLTEDSFMSFRKNLIFNEDLNVREKIPTWFIDVRNLCSLWDALKFLSTYSERRRHIDNEFSELLLYLEFKDEGVLNEKIKEEKVSNNLSSIKKEEKVFISHSAKDKEYAEELVHLLLSFGMDRNKILCTSVPGVQLEVGTPDFLIAIKDYLKNSPLFICMFSQNYLDSPICLCEMGAAWITSKEQRLILTPETEYTLAANTIIGKSNGMKIDERHRIDELIEQFQKMFDLPQKGMVESNRLIERYIKSIKNIFEKRNQ